MEGSKMMENKMNRRTVTYTILTAGYILFIFSNSMRPADISSRDSGTVLLLVQKALDVIGMDNGRITEHIIRKTAHFTEYAVLGLILWNYISCCRLLPAHRLWVLLMSGFLVPFCDETIQLFVAGRSGQISDVWLDCSGVAFGTAAALGILWKTGRKREIENGKKL